MRDLAEVELRHGDEVGALEVASSPADCRGRRPWPTGGPPRRRRSPWSRRGRSRAGPAPRSAPPARGRPSRGPSPGSALVSVLADLGEHRRQPEVRGSSDLPWSRGRSRRFPEEAPVAVGGPSPVLLALQRLARVEQRRRDELGVREVLQEMVVRGQRLVVLVEEERLVALVQKGARVVGVGFLSGRRLDDVDAQRLELDDLLLRRRWNRDRRRRRRVRARRETDEDSDSPRYCPFGSLRPGAMRRRRIRASAPPRASSGLRSPHPGTTFTRTRRSRGPSNSQKKTACQVPRRTLPSSTMSVAVAPITLDLMWASELPSSWRNGSALWDHPRELADHVGLHVGIGVLLDGDSSRRVRSVNAADAFAYTRPLDGRRGPAR